MLDAILASIGGQGRKRPGLESAKLRDQSHLFHLEPVASFSPSQEDICPESGRISDSCSSE